MKDRHSLVKVKNNKQILKQIKIANYAIKEILEEFEADLTELNQLIYVVAYVISSKTNNNKDKKPKLNKCKNPKWREKIEREIENLNEKCLSLRNYQKEYLSNMVGPEKLFGNTIYHLKKLESLKQRKP